VPWCPRCDEVFPDGTACPRCSTRLVDRDRGSIPEELQGIPDFPTIKVSRRDRRALERLSGPKAPSSRVLALAIAALVFAVGFLAGRIGSLEPAGPSVRALPPAEGLGPFDVEGSAVYLLWTNEPLATMAVHDVYSGDVVPRARLSPPFAATGDTRTQVTAHAGSVALVVAEDDASFVTFSPLGKPPHGWVTGVEAAWAAPDVLLVREADDTVVEWSVRAGRVRSSRWGHAERLFQTPNGAIALRSGRLVPGDDAAARGLPVPDGARVLATDGERALVDNDGVALWDGATFKRVQLQGFEAVGGTFEAGGDRVALVVRAGRDLTVAVIDARGDAALKPLGAHAGGCAPTVSWDLSGRWLYVGAGDGMVRAVETAGGHVEPIRTKSVGCGLAWID